MSENDPASHDADRLLHIKIEILSLWRSLPIEHQATIALVLAAEVIDGGAYGPWLRQAIALSRPEQPDEKKGEDSLSLL